MFLFLLISIHRIQNTVCYYSVLHSGNEVNRIITVIIFKLLPTQKKEYYLCANDGKFVLFTPTIFIYFRAHCFVGELTFLLMRFPCASKKSVF